MAEPVAGPGEPVMETSAELAGELVEPVAERGQFPEHGVRLVDRQGVPDRAVIERPHGFGGLLGQGWGGQAGWGHFPSFG